MQPDFPVSPDFQDWVWNTQKPATKDEFVEMLEDNELYEEFLREAGKTHPTLHD